MPRVPRRHAFTLIELLVVISIIALLIGILLPALTAARNASRDLACLAQMRQFAINNEVYANDHKGTYVPIVFEDAAYYAPAAPQVQWYENSYFRGSVGLEPEPPGSPDPVFWPAGYTCPRAQSVLENQFGSLYEVSDVYGLNGGAPFASASNAYRDRRSANLLWFRESEITRHSERMFMADAIDWRTHEGRSGDLIGVGQADAYTGGVTEAPQYRHGGETVNVAFYDGHASAEPIETLHDGDTANDGRTSNLATWDVLGLFD